MKKVLLYSGGLDSFLISKIWKPNVLLYVDIGNEYAAAEKERLAKNVLIVDFPLLSQFEFENKFVPMRNLYFLMIASNYGDEICLGATAGDWGNKDKTPTFLEQAENIINELLSDKKIRKHISVCRDFINVSKSALIRKYIKRGGNINQLKKETFSCYTPANGKECFACYPCFRKFALLYANGAEYTKDEKRKMWEYVRTHIIPTKEQGGYQGTYYTDRGEESIDLIAAVNKLKEEFDYEVGARICS